jgi:lysophospholipase L1-like esterase
VAEQAPGRRLRRGAVPLLIAVVFAILEIAPRVSTPVARAFEGDDRLADILRLFRRDATRIWTLEPGLDIDFQGGHVQVNSLRFRGPEVSAERPDLRVLCLGESLCFGWGVEYAETYSARLQALLAERSGLEVEVIDTGTPGYTTHQGLIVLTETGLELKPDIVTVPYVVNDLDRLRFFRNDGLPDHEMPPDSPWRVKLTNGSAHSYSFMLYKRGVLALLKRLAGPRAQAHGLSLGFEARVPAEQYDANLRRLAQLCDEHGIELLFVLQPLHLPLPAADGEPAEVQPALDALHAGAWTLPEAEATAAMEHARGRLQGVLQDAIDGPDEEVEANLDDSRRWDAYRCRAQSVRYNHIMRRVATETGRPMADVASRVASHGRACNSEEARDPAGAGQRCVAGLYRGDHDDPIHPSPAGHQLYAETMADAIVAAGWLPGVAAPQRAADDDDDSAEPGEVENSD